MAAERDLELLDDYLSNRLDAQGRAEFEERLRKDPGLKSESELQQQFIAGIRRSRVAELKTMLNNVPVAPVSSATAVATKVATWVVVAALVGTASYFYFTQDKGQSAPSKTRLEQKENEAQQEHNATAPDVTRTDDEEPVVSEEPAASEGKAIQVPKASKPGAKSGQPNIDVYDPSKEANTEDKKSDNEQLIKETSSTVSVEVNSTTARKFDYRLQDNSLTLYGPFEKDLYEVLEFFDGDNRSVFLYYRNQFYHLKESGDEIQSLVVVKDPALIKKLKESRNK